MKSQGDKQKKVEKMNCPNCKQEYDFTGKIVNWIQCHCGWKWEGKWLSPKEQIIPMNSPKDYLTDRVAEFRKQFVGKDGQVLLFTDDKDKWLSNGKLIEAFLTDTIIQSMEVGRQEIIDKLKKEKAQCPVCNSEFIIGSFAYFIRLLNKLSPKL